jgi:ATP-dependent DNA helicase RecQ
VETAEPAVGRTRTVEILCGGRSKVIEQHSYDGLPGYGTFAHMRRAEVLERVDALLATGTLQSTGGRFPKLVTVA